MSSGTCASYISWGADLGASDVTLSMRMTSGDVVYKQFPLDDKDRFTEEINIFSGKIMPSVGSGSWRLSENLEREYGILVEKHREPVCIWTAIESSLINPVVNGMSAFQFEYGAQESSMSYPISAPYKDIDDLKTLMKEVSYNQLLTSFPILLVIVKTGTSFYRMDSPSEFVRVGGSSIGSSSLGALGLNLVNEASVSGMVSKARELTRPSNCDLLVEDIYGGDCSSIGLPGSIIASCLGKADDSSINSPALAKSLLDMMTINTAQLANLHARIHNCKSAIVVGPLCEELEVSECMQRVLYILAGKDKASALRAVFFRNSKYLGCLGAMLRREMLVQQLRVRGDDIPIDTATVEDGLHDETYTKLRVSAPLR